MNSVFISGIPASGKTYLAKKHGFNVFKSADAAYDFLVQLIIKE